MKGFVNGRVTVSKFRVCRSCFGFVHEKCVIEKKSKEFTCKFCKDVIVGHKDSEAERILQQENDNVVVNDGLREYEN